MISMGQEALKEESYQVELAPLENGSRISGLGQLLRPRLAKIVNLPQKDFDHELALELHSPRLYVAEDGSNIPMTYRVFNSDYLNNGNPAVVYNFSLFVPGHRGAELPTLYDITKLAKKHKSAVIAITTDGYANDLSAPQLESLKDFHAMARRKLSLLESICCEGQELIVTGSSLGGMMSYDMAALNAEKSHPRLRISKIISICSAGHNGYSPADLAKAFKQFSLGELMPVMSYVKADLHPAHMLHRYLELIETFPSNLQQVSASAIIAYAILRSPLIAVEQKIPPYTEVIDELYLNDPVSQPHLRKANWAKADHPKDKHDVQLKPGNHLALLTVGRLTTLKYLFDSDKD